ncbi:hypothetical protein KPP03845_106356 [Streptomyces xanthophaeus]|uniref:DUF5682 family protein n=1 Tax=Streptomyces xanthophaeus TaxID=67385 RepID=UPI00233ECFCF|nr:DUF5682 family protein [Streptomyces xanthophaeus]WCD89932.1 hypothetical protein KPP03845_106356 [Streptomyces xanthophaeus]
MAVTFLGVRHHSPACARLVARTISDLRPAHVLIEGPAELGGRLDELLLGHELPVAVFSHYRDEERSATSWAPFCDYSPEWVALTAGRAAGAQVHFIDLPAWHPAFDGRTNRYADAEARYEQATALLCRRFEVDSVDALWDRLFEAGPQDDGAAADGPAERLAAYFDVVRGDTEADEGDRAREAYMASWVRAAVAAAGQRPVLVVTGGFHRPALRALVEAGGPVPDGWPEVPPPPPGAVGGSFLVPYSFRQLDAFCGYQSGMPSPAYYQQLWEEGARAAGEGLVRAVTGRLRERGHPVSTAALVAARSTALGLAALRGHPEPTRLDLLDGLAGALVTDALDEPLPWTRRGPLGPGAHPAVVEMVAACGGDRVGRLHPDTPAPPLVHDVEAALAGLGLDSGRPVTLRLTDPADLGRSQVLHRLRVLGVPGFERVFGPADGSDPVFTERWEPRTTAPREAALIEAGGFGATLAEAAAVALGDRARAAGAAPGALAGVLFDAVVCGAADLSGRLVAELGAGLGRASALGPLGEALSTALGLWRHDRVYGVARDPLLAAVVDTAVTRVLWLAEGAGGAGGPDAGRLQALAAVRDALLHAEGLLSVSRETAAGICGRISADRSAPASLRGAAFGLCRVLSEAAPAPAGATGSAGAAARAVAGPQELGDWLAGLFALARAELTGGGGPEPLIDVLDELLAAMTETDFLVGLPSLRQAFAYFPPREREQIAARLIERRGLRGSARSLLRTTADPLLIARARALEDHVGRTLDRYGLGATPRHGAVPTTTGGPA